MKTRQQKTLDLVIAISVPSTAEEFDQLAQKADACVDAASSEIVYRSYLPTFKNEFLRRLEEETGISRIVEKDGEKVISTEKDTDFWDRVLEESGKTPADFQALAQEVADSIEFSPVPKVRTGKIAKNFYDAADNVLKAIADGATTVDSLRGKLEEPNPGVTLAMDGETLDRESLASAIKINAARISREASNTLLG